MSWLLDYFEAWNRSDAKGVASYMADDVVFIDMAMEHKVEGNANIAEFVRQSAEYAPGASFEIVNHFVAEDHYFAEWIWHPREIPGVSVGTLRGGKIAVNHDYWNKALLKPKKS